MTQNTDDNGLKPWPDNVVADRHEITNKWVLHYLTDEQTKLCNRALNSQTDINVAQPETKIISEDEYQEYVNAAKCVRERLNPIEPSFTDKGYVSVLDKLKSPEMVDLIAELQANGWEYGTHPREKAQIIINAIVKEIENV